MIKTIVFDLGNVLLHNNPKRACKRLDKNCELGIYDVLWFAPELYEKLETGKLTTKQLYVIAKKRLGLKITQSQFVEMFSDMFTDYVATQNLVKKLVKDYPLILCSNTSATHFNYIKKKHPILNLFKHHVLSYKVGYMKPHPKIYDTVIKKANVDPRECVFVDDRKENVLAAKRSGMHAIHFLSPSQLKKELYVLGVRW